MTEDWGPTESCRCGHMKGNHDPGCVICSCRAFISPDFKIDLKVPPHTPLGLKKES